MQCKALILKTNSLSLPSFVLDVRHMFTPTSVAAFGKGGILHLHFRKTGRHIVALTLEQMCNLFYLKRATDVNTAVTLTVMLTLSSDVNSDVNNLQSCYHSAVTSKGMSSLCSDVNSDVNTLQYC